MDAVSLIASLNAFHIIGGFTAVWAVALTALGISREGFPASRGQALLVALVSVLFTAGAISAAVITGKIEAKQKKEEEEAAEAEAARAEGGAVLELTADRSGKLAFDRSTLDAKAGRVTIAMTNPSSIPHNVSIEGAGVEERGKVVEKGGTSTVSATLRPGRYTFYCSVPGHRQLGMEGTLTAR